MSMIAADLPPRPWNYLTNEDERKRGGFVYILDANGRKIASMWGTAKEKIALAELICDAAEKL